MAYFPVKTYNVTGREAKGKSQNRKSMCEGARKVATSYTLDFLPSTRTPQPPHTGVVSGK
jgi:hypothetical protein